MRYASHRSGRSPLLWLGAAGLAIALALVVPSQVSRGAQAPGEAPLPAAAATKGTVLITGANRGIGLEFAKEYYAAGWNVIATAREPGAAKELKELGEGVRIVQLDVTSAESVAAMTKTLDKQPIDLLINNAGVGVGTEGGKGLENLKMEDFERVFQVNTVGPVRVTQALLPNLRAGKGKKIVGISSGLGSVTWNNGGGYYGYRESKAALDMFMRTLAAELKPEGFICIPIIPGWVKTDMGGPNAQLSPEQSVSGMRKVIDGLKPEDSGKFWSHDGTNVPW